VLNGRRFEYAEEKEKKKRGEEEKVESTDVLGECFTRLGHRRLMLKPHLHTHVI